MDEFAPTWRRALLRLVHDRWTGPLAHCPGRTCNGSCALSTCDSRSADEISPFLMMATYGMGAGEVYELKLEDIDWKAKTIRLRRPKTGVVTILPLLDAVARALAQYLRHERPTHTRTRNVFVTDHMPHRPLSGSTTIRHRLAKYAEAAGISAAFLGTHVFRHSHATRQIEGGAPPKVIADVLGHRRPESTSVYVRGAVVRLRAIALPVPQ